MPKASSARRSRSNGASGGLEPAEAVLERAVRALEVCAKAPRGGLAAPPGEGMLARVAEELPVDAHQEVRRDLRVGGVDAELLLNGRREVVGELRHHLDLLRLQ